MDEVRDWREAGLDTIVSLLERHEVVDLDLEEEGAICAAHGIEFISYPIEDRGVPASIPHTIQLVDSLVERLANGRGVGVHCRVGIGRSGLISGCVLVRLGVPYKKVFPALTLARGTDVPDTVEQEHWVRLFSESGS